jgi:hypothetical protein
MRVWLAVLMDWKAEELDEGDTSRWTMEVI